MIDRPVTALQTHKTGYLCIVQNIIQQGSRDHEFINPRKEI